MRWTGRARRYRADDGKVGGEGGTIALQKSSGALLFLGGQRLVVDWAGPSVLERWAKSAKGRTVQHERVRVEHELVAAVGDEPGNVPSGFESSQLQEACSKGQVWVNVSQADDAPLFCLTASPISSALRASPWARISANPSTGDQQTFNRRSRADGLARCLLLLYRLIDQEGRALCRLLCDLLALDGRRESGRELRGSRGVSSLAESWTGQADGEVGNGDVVEDEVEAGRPAGQVLPDEAGHHFTLSDELRRVSASGALLSPSVMHSPETH